jgi:hypothetical protein
MGAEIDADIGEKIASTFGKSEWSLSLVSLRRAFDGGK